MIIITSILAIGAIMGWPVALYLIISNEKDTTTDIVYEVSPPQAEDQGTTSQEEVQIQNAIDCYLKGGAVV